MSRSPFFYLEKYNIEKNVWEVYSPYEYSKWHDKIVRIDFWPWNGTHDVFNALTIDGMNGIHNGLPNDVSEEVLKVYKECESPTAHWINYADIYINALEEPEVEDYDEEAMYDPDKDEDVYTTKKKMIPSPAVVLRDRVKQFIDILDSFGIDDSKIDYRIVYWII